ncbi:hypothetical protein [Levilactobacillus fuyuanensis]|uniref:DNA-directed RNA polymerase beta subunit n=1 Tax=Levilactobacillus fuyuanensis TaxID=2486022 RepID=A0ABW4H2Q3_9LACO|nr:hypothetical protein [Levilactobacillus fuyuanensis]
MILHQAPDDKLATEFFHRDYHDRGMLKWGGFYLSDHTSALAKMHAAERVEHAQPQQPLTEISRELAAAWHAQQPVHLQLNILDDDQVLTTVDGIVAGVNEDQIVLQLASDHFRYLTLAEIRWVAWAQ